MFCIRQIVEKQLENSWNCMNCVQTSRKTLIVRSVVLLSGSSKFRKASFRFLIFLCLSVCLFTKSNCVPNGRVLMKFIFRYFCQNCKQIQISSKYDNNRYGIWRSGKLYAIIWLDFSYYEKYFRKTCRENQNILCSKNCFLIRVLSVIVWNNNLEPERTQIAM